MIAAINQETTNWMAVKLMSSVYQASLLEFLQNRWLNCLAYLEVDPESKIAHKWLNAVVARYDHHDRIFHDLDRLHDQLQDLQVVAECENATRLTTASLTFAMFFQYYEYVPGHTYQVAMCNADTAMLAAKDIGISVGPSDFIYACLVNSWDKPCHSYNQSIFHDAELSILGEQPDRYDQYVQYLYLECCDWADERWYEARNKWLERMLRRAEKNELYGTLTCRSAINDTAKANMERELARNIRRLDSISAFTEADTTPTALTDPYYDAHEFSDGMKIGEHIYINGVLHMWDGEELVVKETESDGVPF
jgi:predicted metal-dependent HD superfamily phosphohydrolase